jgi:hypothetical protein
VELWSEYGFYVAARKKLSQAARAGKKAFGAGGKLSLC